MRQRSGEGLIHISFSACCILVRLTGQIPAGRDLAIAPNVANKAMRLLGEPDRRYSPRPLKKVRMYATWFFQ